MPQTLSDRAAITSPLALMTSREARALGIRVPAPEYHRVRSGIYVDAAAWARLPAWRRYHVRVHALLRAAPDVTLCLESAAVVHGIPLFGHPRDLHVYDSRRTSSRRFGDVCVHTGAQSREVVDVGGIRVTSLLDTAVDLTRVLPPAHGLAAADAVVAPAQGGRLSISALRERARERPSARGAAIQREVWALVDERIESPHEAVSHALILWAGFEMPEPQVEYRYEGSLDRCDFTFRAARAVGEADGWGKYDLADPAAASRALANEKRREDRLRRHGHRVARWEPRDPYRVTPVARALQQAGVRVERPEQRALIATLRAESRRNLPAPTPAIGAGEKPHHV
ncbi:hypothetical protein [Microbacterium sp.]|uniref:hypothetical protein n=1 Tax=Microbacterium sp. TaxID=51671 RepID=UPI0025E00F5C|nr:hypothetical protein [Microbacterium sp.]